VSLCFYDFFIKQLSDSVPVKKDKLHTTDTLFNQYSSAHDGNPPELPSPQFLLQPYLLSEEKGERHILLSPGEP
jgi:hypothetical protein